MSNTGVVSASGPLTVGSSTTEIYEGAILNSGALSLTETSNNNVTETGTLTLNTTTHVYTTTLTASNGDVATVYLTAIPSVSTFAGIWTGPEDNAGTSTQVSTETATISSTGAITGSDVVTANSDVVTQSGFIDAYGNWLIASENATLGHFVDIGTATISNGTLTANYTIFQAGNTTPIGNFTATLTQ